MFANIRKCLDDFENVCNSAPEKNYVFTEEDGNILDYFDIHLAEALMRDYSDAENIAKFILVKKGSFTEMTVM